ncbi:four-carbon acid sugar kinase family protein [Jiangella asiatica]|uniref:4-hydroxythreonine-4-phosphate dehydrogenase n=1 Tax=Jiangella asiatica TaxID=2530372 RepID=A0A4R5CRR6_9ACTN|nr:four-carbon acid sugar kinase family protein [Jiangella asiatica]TDE02217.1 4-hydroxythreonine-4-phosphate dehydrogenase [Jiangella asiatica]
MVAPVLLVADDLTGSAEAAAAFLPRTVRIRWWSELRETRDSGDGREGDVLAVDTDSRYVRADEAARRCRSALALLPAGGTVVKKVDSTLRGPLAAELAALRADGAPLVVAPALPALGRTVIGGAVRVDGVPLERSASWAAESRPAPSSVAEALRPLPAVVVGLDVVRGAADRLAAALLAAADAATLPVCDAETDADLDHIVHAGALTGRPVRWAGSAGLAHALARTSRAPAAGTTPPAPTARPPALFVVGSAAPSARAQLDRLTGWTDTVVELEPALLTDPGLAATVAGRTAGRNAVVHLAAADGAERSPDVVAALARAVAPAAADHPTLVLTGGETARAVLAAIGAGELLVRDAWDDGVVVSTAPDGHVVVTKPGAFGDPDTLLRVARRLTHEEDT